MATTSLTSPSPTYHQLLDHCPQRPTATGVVMVVVEEEEEEEEELGDVSPPG